jgi:hypothetical protein
MPSDTPKNIEKTIEHNNDEMGSSVKLKYPFTKLVYSESMKETKLINNPVSEGGSEAGEGAFPPTPSEPAVETCPHNKITVVRTLVGSDLVRSVVKAEAKVLAEECNYYYVDMMECVTIYDCGCLVLMSDDSLDIEAYIIPADQSLQWLQNEVKYYRDFEYSFKKYRKLFPSIEMVRE